MSPEFTPPYKNKCHPADNIKDFRVLCQLFLAPDRTIRSIRDDIPPAGQTGIQRGNKSLHTAWRRIIDPKARASFNSDKQSVDRAPFRRAFPARACHRGYSVVKRPFCCVCAILALFFTVNLHQGVAGIIMGSALEIRPVTSAGDLRHFINLPRRIYADDPAWVPPLYLERRLHFSSFNPFFRDGIWQAWTAWQNGRPVGRICAHVNRLHRRHFSRQTGHFGLLEAADDPEIFAALLSASEHWLTEQQTEYITGPFNFSINQECGILVDGFDTPPVIMMPHSREWYDRRIRAQGYAPAMDLLAYWVDISFPPPKAMKVLQARYSGQIRVRSLRRNAFREEIETLRTIFNDAWSANWGFIPFDKREFADMGNSLRLFVPDDFIQIAEIGGQPVAFIVVLPNLNEVLQKINGRLLPLGWLKLVLAVKSQDFQTGRVPLMGVLRKYQNTPVGIALAYKLIDTLRHPALARGIREVEMSWILQDNKGMRSILDSIGSRQYKRYRIYEKILGNPGNRHDRITDASAR